MDRGALRGADATDLALENLMTEQQAFDHHSAEHAADPVCAYRAIRQGPGSVRTDAHGGYTVLTRYEDIAAAASDHSAFSSAFELPGDEGYGGGITLPRNPDSGRTSLAEMDPPEWRRYRRMLNPIFTPGAVSRFSPRIQAITDEAIDRFVTKGSCDLVLDLVSPVPAIVTLEVLGMDTSEWERYAVPLHTSVYIPRDVRTPAWQELQDGFRWIFQQIRDEIARRRAEPKEGDLLAAIMNADDPEGPLDDALVFETAYTIVAAGVETTTSLLSSALWHLDRFPQDRQRLLDDPSLLDAACEEFLRYYTPEQAGARTVAQHAEIGDESFERGERVLLAWSSANRDEAQFPDADRFVLDRRPNRHMSFGYGIHRCLGSHLARQEIKIVLGEVLRRLPDYAIDRQRTELYPDLGLMYGYKHMPATFTPGERKKA
ncbi:cytochrome P450 [Streptomyces sp. CB02414]|uniref:cytochrome P450 n=1 Tax=Streptomyces sp. CB02414 TaxID=1703922 RepID=UPI00116105C8|nr:cytochrome P450 [Streptomyces sp. CB02414]